MADRSVNLSNQEAVLALRGVSTAYDGHQVLWDICIDVQPGEALAIIGPSASGKSTLLRCCNLLQPLSTGEISYEGRCIAKGPDVLVHSDEYRQKVGIVHQEWNLWPNRTVLQNLTDAPRYVLGWSRSTATSRALQWLDRFDLGEVAKRYPHQVSSGQKQRVAIARALMMEPAILMLDEPTSSLDVETTSKLLNLLESLRDGNRTFIYVTHHLQFAQRATDRTAVLIAGRIVEMGPSQHIIAEPADEQTWRFLTTIRKTQ